MIDIYVCKMIKLFGFGGGGGRGGVFKYCF